MSAMPAGPLDWRAIALGAAATVAVGVSSSFLLQQAFAGGFTPGYGTLLALTALVGLVADAIGGAVAGLLAKRRGAMHGLLAMVLAGGFGLVVSVVMLGRQGHLAVLASVSYWLQWLAMAALGLAVGALAGHVAARVAAAKSAR